MIKQHSKNAGMRVVLQRVAGGMLCAGLVLGAFMTPAHARWDERRDRREYYRDYHHRDYHHGWNGGYYASPPVVYGPGYYNGYGYYPPPVVYGPGLGLYLPNLSIGIR